MLEGVGGLHLFHPQGPTVAELAEQAFSSVERGYDLLAAKFDVTPYRTPDAMLSVVAAHVGSCDSALDLCCGTGAGLKMLRPLCSNRLAGIDFSGSMLEVARRELNDTEGTGTVELIQGDVLTTELGGPYDVITCFGAFGHILPSEMPELLGRIRKALKPGGRFIFLTTPRPAWWTRWFWAGHAFNWLIHLRNRWIDPPFVMYYFTFPTPEAMSALARDGFHPRKVSGLFQGRYSRYDLVIASRP